MTIIFINKFISLNVITYKDEVNNMKHIGTIWIQGNSTILTIPIEFGFKKGDRVEVEIKKLQEIEE